MAITMAWKINLKLGCSVLATKNKLFASQELQRRSLLMCLEIKGHNNIACKLTMIYIIIKNYRTYHFFTINKLNFLGGKKTFYRIFGLME